MSAIAAGLGSRSQRRAGSRDPGRGLTRSAGRSFGEVAREPRFEQFRFQAREPFPGEFVWREIGRRGFFGRQSIRREARSRLDHAGEFHRRQSFAIRASSASSSRPVWTTPPAEAPTFRGANFSGAHIIARLSRFDLRGANFHGAKMGADMKNQSMGLMRSDLSGADLAGANFSQGRSEPGIAALRQPDRSQSEPTPICPGPIFRAPI